MASPTPDLQPGITFDQYTLRRRLGAGGMGEVWLALESITGRDVALKLMGGLNEPTADQRKRFAHEISLLASLDHPNIALYAGHGWFHNRPYFVMQVVDGPSVETILNKRGRLDESLALSIAVQASSGLDHAHKKADVIHRDLKPANMLVDRRGRAEVDDQSQVKLIDFGLSLGRMRGENDHIFGSTDKRISHFDESRVVVGTPLYIAPEQIIKGDRIDFRADIYGLGATLYHLLTGRPPFPLDDVEALLEAHCKAPVPDPGDLVPELKPATRQLVMRAMAKLPDSRFATWEAFTRSARTAYNVATGGLRSRRTDVGHDSGASATLAPPTRTLHGQPRTTDRVARTPTDQVQRKTSGPFPVQTPTDRRSTGTHPAIVASETHPQPMTGATIRESPPSRDPTTRRASGEIPPALTARTDRRASAGDLPPQARTPPPPQARTPAAGPGGQVTKTTRTPPSGAASDPPELPDLPPLPASIPPGPQAVQGPQNQVQNGIRSPSEIAARHLPQPTSELVGRPSALDRNREESGGVDAFSAHDQLADQVQEVEQELLSDEESGSEESGQIDDVPLDELHVGRPPEPILSARPVGSRQPTPAVPPAVRARPGPGPLPLPPELAKPPVRPRDLPPGFPSGTDQANDDNLRPELPTGPPVLPEIVGVSSLGIARPSDATVFGDLSSGARPAAILPPQQPLTSRSPAPPRQRMPMTPPGSAPTLTPTTTRHRPTTPTAAGRTGGPATQSGPTIQRAPANQSGPPRTPPSAAGNPPSTHRGTRRLSASHHAPNPAGEIPPDEISDAIAKAVRETELLAEAGRQSRIERQREQSETDLTPPEPPPEGGLTGRIKGLWSRLTGQDDTKT